MARPRRHIIVTLTPEEWDRLVRAGLADERDPWQQARWLLRQHLGGDPSEAEPAPEPEAVA